MVATVLVLVAVVLTVAEIRTSAAGAESLIATPVSTVTTDGLTATDGIRILSASQTQGLPSSGSSVTVTGSGYDTNKGVYVAFCLIPPTNQQPTPCGGGVDTTGASGTSQWISTNAPAYGEGLATPYGPGGTFALTLAVSPKINDTIDCRRVRCAIVTRNDHTRTSDRGQDVFLPVTFAADVQQPAPSPSDPSAQPAPSGQPVDSTTTTAPEALPAPAVTLSEDGRIATAGTLSVEVSQAQDLDRLGQPVTVTGSGFDESKGIGIAYCVVNGAGEAPGPCADGSANPSTAVAWFSSNPPEGGDAALPYQPGGAFTFTLATSPTIGDVDCTSATCAVVTSNDSSRPLDRSQDVIIPLSFEAPAEVVAPTAEAVADTDDEVAAPEDETSASVWPFLVGGLAVIAVGGGIAFLIKRKRGDAAP